MTVKAALMVLHVLACKTDFDGMSSDWTVVLLKADRAKKLDSLSLGQRINVVQILTSPPSRF